MLVHPLTDEILEKLWYFDEAGKAVASSSDLRMKLDFDQVEATIEELSGDGLLDVGSGLRLTTTGEERARGIVRRHRLAEVLFAEVMHVDLEDAEASACELEHTLTERVVDRVCTFMGHPPKCPHGKSIPAGSCCRLYDRRVEPLISRLIDVPLGTSSAIVFIAPKSAARLNRLASLGGRPGHRRQTSPAQTLGGDPVWRNLARDRRRGRGRDLRASLGRANRVPANGGTGASPSISSRA